MTYSFEIEGKIIGKERPRVNLNTGIVYTPNKTKEYENYIRQIFKIKYPNFEMITSRVSINIIAYIGISKSISKKDKEKMLNDEMSPIKKPDIDNIAKVILDALDGFVLQNDKQVTKMSVEKRYSDVEKLFVKIEEY